MAIEVLNPTYGDDAERFQPAARLATLTGTTVGFVSNGKHGTVLFFDALERRLRDDFGVAEVVRVVKANYSAPAGDELMAQARHWHALVAGIGD